MFEYWGRHVTVLQFDKRGIGISDRFEEVPTLEQRIEDITAVMDAPGVRQASLVGMSEGGLMAQLFSSIHPERVLKVVLLNSLIGENGAWSMPESHVTVATERFTRIAESWAATQACMVEWSCRVRRTTPHS